jgi:hypothetical protein
MGGASLSQAVADLRKVRVDNLNDLRDKVATIQNARANQGFIFRGQRATYDLSTTLERACQTAKIHWSDMPEWEWKVSREFRRRYHHYAVHVPAMNHDIEWLALMQHHGAPTRLLDWTYSLDVAIYFALQKSRNAKDGAAIWMMNATWATHESAAKFKALGRLEAADFISGHLASIDDQAKFGPTFMTTRPWVPCACPVNPYRLNERLTIQRGIFVTVGDVTEPFKENLKALTGSDEPENVAAYIVPASAIQDGLKTLYDLNISDATLFPGLDGFARSLDISIASAAPRLPPS